MQRHIYSYPQGLRVVVKFYGQNTDHSRAVILQACSSLIFKCVILYAKRLSGVLRQRILAIYSSFIFICFILYAKRLSGVLRQRILMTYSPLIFAYANYARQSTFFKSARITYFCMRMTPTNVFQQNIHSLSLCDFCLRKAVPKPPIMYFYMQRVCLRELL